ncbi:MAG TPA: GNAT family N-acetyltransferase [Amnibacterium sp.]|jgi:ribosomal protein S18 acetylase RimI-like enzyme|uniref:GNAT family N-acetyltransferase n=1 Tax=Amnibacterium sp. TaxID=1872496 RepID=UPI002F93A92B
MQETDGDASPVVALPDGPAGVTWRRIDAGSVDAVHAIARRIAEDETPGFPVGRSELDRSVQAAGSPGRTALAMRDGEPVAFGFVVPGAAAVRLPGGVLPAVHGLGIGRRLLAWQVAQARAVGAGPALPMGVRQPSVAVRTAALLAHAGFRPERTFLHLRRSPGAIRPAPLPADLRSAPFETRFDEPLRVAKNLAFADHWRSSPEDPEAWAQHHLGSWLRRDLSRLALTADERVAGFVVTWEPEDVTDESYVALVGTDPERRGEGIARALLTEVVAASAAAGRPVVTLEVDADSPTGADRLYASVGFERALEAVIHGLPS